MARKTAQYILNDPDEVRQTAPTAGQTSAAPSVQPLRDGQGNAVGAVPKTQTPYKPQPAVPTWANGQLQADKAELPAAAVQTQAAQNVQPTPLTPKEEIAYKLNHDMRQNAGESNKDVEAGRLAREEQDRRRDVAKGWQESVSERNNPLRSAEEKENAAYAGRYGTDDKTKFFDPGTLEKAGQDASSVQKSAMRRLADDAKAAEEKEAAQAPQEKEKKENNDGEKGKTPKTYEEMFKALYRMPSDEELEKERKRTRRRKTIAAISDGISALANLYFTGQYAPNAYTGKNTQSKAVKDRWDELEADFKSRKKDYYTGLLKAMELDKAAGRKDDDAAQKKAKADRQAENDAKANARKQNESEALVRQRDAAASLSGAKQKTEEATRPGKVALNNAKAATEKGKGAVQKSQVAKNYAQANKTQRDADGGDASYNEFYALYSTPEGKAYARRYAENNNMNVLDNKRTEKGKNAYGVETDVPSSGRSGTWSDKKNREAFIKFYRTEEARKAKAKKRQNRTGGNGSGSAMSKVSI